MGETDLISRQAAINSFRYDDDGTAWDVDDIVYRLEQFPSAQPMMTNAADLINRGDAILAVNKRIKQVGMENNADVLSIRQSIRDLPSAQPEQLWIPSGEKQPEEGSYLVWMPFAPPKHRMAVAEYCGGYWNIKTPISAWMPLPAPWKGEQPC